MVKVLLILLIGLAFESAGVILLKKGMDRIGQPDPVTLSQIVRLIKAGIASPQILLGVFFEALFFVSLLILMRKSDISFLWPLTGLSFVFATFAAMWFLHERVAPLRWAGVVLIMLGAAVISYSEQAKEKPTPPAGDQKHSDLPGRTPPLPAPEAPGREQ
jgi:drug/metabolite transporter (DMT)-like permease